ncbi:MAG: TIGR01548 family HAD-type hydrolase [Pseudanabaenaceae cyanobacterium bins.68]|nr:TIGR01548 family HAD-type hydrolase [Pseudanabaenaceae cyanobacterium bins.68]
MKINTCPILIFDIDGVIRDVSQSYRRALADTVEHFTNGAYRPTSDQIDCLKAEGLWNNDWEAARELVGRFAQELEPSLAQIIQFFQQRYRGDDWNGYIQAEKLLVNLAYFQQLTAAGIKWGFFSGASRDSARFVLDRVGLTQPVLVAMEDAPSKPDPSGLCKAIALLEPETVGRKVIYAGDTAADMITVVRARELLPQDQFWAVGVLPPHVLDRANYGQLLHDRGADLVIDQIMQLTPGLIFELLG